MSERLEPCPECKGTGAIVINGQELVCSDCDGTGEIEVEHESDEDDTEPLKC